MEFLDRIDERRLERFLAQGAERPSEMAGRLQVPFAARYKTVLSRLFVAEATRPGEDSLEWAEDMKGVR